MSTGMTDANKKRFAMHNELPAYRNRNAFHNSLHRQCYKLSVTIRVPNLEEKQT